MPLVFLSASDAFERLKANRNSQWPDGRRDRTRLGGIAEVALEPSFVLEPGEPVFTIGSCFARNIEARLAELGFELPTLQLSLPPEERASDTDNDLLNKYPPHSMLNELRWALEPGAEFPRDGLLEVRRDKWHDPHLAGNTAHATLARVLERRRMVTEIYRQAPRCRVIVVTLGLVEAWFDCKTGLYLNGAPPITSVRDDPDRFRFDVLSVAEVVEALEGLHALLKLYGHPDFRMLLTVSPVPFKATFTGRDAIAANTYSKSALRAAAETFVLAHEDVDYFPSYEIVTHTPRSAAYIQDNRHVTANAVNEIVDRVVDAYCPSLDDSLAEPRRSAGQLNNLLKSNDFPAALQIFKTLARKERFHRLGWKPGEFHLLYGKTLARSGAHAQAQIELARAVEIDPGSASANYNLGITLNKLQRPIEAEVYIRRSVELDPRSLEMRVRYIRQLVSNGDTEHAKDQVRVAAQLHPDSAQLSETAAELGLQHAAYASTQDPIRRPG